MKTVLFVCSGNTCRSPMALAAWQALEREKPLAGWEARSAGTMATAGLSASAHAQGVARDWKIDLSTHLSQPLTQTLLEQSQSIVTMTQQQAEMVKIQFPDAAHKVDMLGHYAALEKVADIETLQLEQLLQALNLEENFDILDPFGGSREEYQSCGAHIYRAVEALRESLREETR